jgi:hypothetical protein
LEMAIDTLTEKRALLIAEVLIPTGVSMN